MNQSKMEKFLILQENAANSDQTLSEEQET